MPPRSHVWRFAVGLLLVDKKHNPQPLGIGRWRIQGQRARDGQERCDACAVVVRAWTVLRGIIVRPDDDRSTVGGPIGRLEHDFNIANRDAIDVEFLRNGCSSARLDLIFDVTRGGFEGLWVLQVVRLAGDGTDVASSATCRA